MAIDLTDLIEIPRETLEIELKEWLDLSEPLVRANIARHLAALANHGGGYLVFGFKDDLSRDQTRPFPLDHYNRDAFGGIIKRYLTPTFQCEVTLVQDRNGEQFPVVRVPSHQQVPIASRADGPKDAKGRIQGIAASTYYIRKPGPESAPIIGAEDWTALIRRCVLNDRDSLLSDIAGLVQARANIEPALTQRLMDWHREAEKRFLQLISQRQGAIWPVPFQTNRYQLSYLISTRDNETIPENSLYRILEEVNNEVRSVVWTGWSMFYPFNRPDIAPAFHPERLDGTGPDVLEGNLLGDKEFYTSLPDFWRIAPDGRATLIRAYREDRERSVKELARPAGTWLSPETVFRETAELVTHARLLSRKFESATRISFRCSWIGLRGRALAEFNPSTDCSPSREAKADQRTVEGEWPVAQVVAAWPAIVAELGCPILRLFGLTDCSAKVVERMAPKFVKL